MNFTLKEFENSAIASKRGLSNKVPASLMPAALHTLTQMELVRHALGDNPCTISSGYRGPVVNKLAGGSPTSGHMKAEAVDFTCNGYGSTREVVKKLAASGIEFDQLILENPNIWNSWVHISFRISGNRGQVMTKLHGDRTYYQGIK